MMIKKRTDGEARDAEKKERDTDPLTGGSHLLGRTKKLAETILALILYI
jgi:hypothetical protein